MQLWMVLQFAFALAVVIGIISLIIAKLHIIERAEDQKLWEQIKDLREKLAALN